MSPVAFYLKKFIRTPIFQKLEEKMETLRLFLETVDFKQLRAESENRFIEGRKVKIMVYLDNEQIRKRAKVLDDAIESRNDEEIISFFSDNQRFLYESLCKANFAQTV